jgi:hypothetical protein
MRVFLKVQTQWRADSGVVIGLDYGSVRWVIEMLQLADPLEVLADLQVVEATVVAAMNKRKG